MLSITKTQKQKPRSNRHDRYRELIALKRNEISLNGIQSITQKMNRYFSNKELIVEIFTNEKFSFTCFSAGIILSTKHSQPN